MPAFTNLLKLDTNIVVYTDESFEKQVRELFEEYSFTNYRIEIHDLLTYRYSDSIFRIKEEKGIIDENGLVEGLEYIRNDRNHHICLSKVEFLQKSISSKFFDSKYFYWIDGGLFHHGLIPFSMGGMEMLIFPDEKRMWPENKLAISNPTFFTKLRNKTEKDLTFLGLEGWYSRPQYLTEFFSNFKKAHIVGGLFGGEVDALLEFCKQFELKVDCLFANNVLSLEEDILSGVLFDHFTEQNYLPFKYWSHDKPEEPNYLGAPPGSDSFYKLFL